MNSSVWEEMMRHITPADRVRLILDYDGTLADFAPTPEVIEPDPELIALLTRLVKSEKYLPAVLSGRSLQHLRELLPMDGLLMAGTYGIEIELPDGSQIRTLEYGRVRPTMEELLPKWQALLEGQAGFFLEDKGWSLALHARYADIADARRVLDSARSEIEALSARPNFAVEHRERFLEITPVEANKHRGVETILSQYTPAGALPIYIGDDLNDEEAFKAVLAAGGLCVRVSENSVQTQAQYQLAGPREVRQLLSDFGAQE